MMLTKIMRLFVHITDVSEDIPVYHEVAGHGDQEACHGSVGELTVLDCYVWKYPRLFFLVR